MWSSWVGMNCPTYLMTLKSLSWKGGSRRLILAASPHSLPLTRAHWGALARPPTTSTLTPSPAGCLWSSALLCRREGQAGHARAPLPLGAALPMTEGSWYIHTPAPSPTGGRTTRCLQHSIPEGPGRVSTVVSSAHSPRKIHWEVYVTLTGCSCHLHVCRDN